MEPVKSRITSLPVDYILQLLPTYDEIDIWEDVFCLHKLPRMAIVEHVVDSICIDAHRTPRLTYVEKRCFKLRFKL